jgi:hypothetical protein
LAPSPTPFATSLATPFPFDWLDRGLPALLARDFVALALGLLGLRVVFAFAVLEARDFFAGFALLVFV